MGAPTFTTDDIGHRCLVTGGAGYLGRYLTQRLVASGCEVVSLDLRESDVLPPEVEQHAVDIQDYDGIAPHFEGVDTVFHSAALIDIAENVTKATRRRVYGVNVVGTEAALRAAQDAGVSAFVHTSSMNVVMDHPINQGDETLPYATASDDLYTRTKIAAEERALAADGESGLRVCALRPGGIWGPVGGCLSFEAFIMKAEEAGFDVGIGGTESVVPWTHVENLVDAELLAARALRSEPEVVGGRAYFITDDEEINGNAFFRPIAEALGFGYPTRFLPGGLLKWVARGMELAARFSGAEPMLTVRGVRNLTESTSFSIERARGELGYEPRYAFASDMQAVIPEARAFLADLRTNEGTS